MAYMPTTEEGKAALAAGADPTVVEEMEKEGTLPKDDSKPKDPPHVEKSAEEKAAEEAAAKAKADADAATAAGDGEIPPDRAPQHMPIWKHKEELKKREDELRVQHQTELEVALKTAAQKPGGASGADVEKFAEEFNLTPEVASSMIDRMASVLETRLGLGDIKKDVEKSKEREQQIAEQQGFENEWSAEATTKALETAAGGKQVTKEVRDKVKELAYSTTYAKYRLADIIRLEAETLFAATPKESRPAEGSRGGSARGPAQKTITEMTSDEINSLSDAEFIKLSNELGGTGSRFQKVTRAKK